MTALILVLLILGLVLLATEAHLPSFGVVGGLGVAALSAAIVLAVVASGAGAGLALGVTLPLAAVALGLTVVAARKSLAADRRRARCGAEGLVGHVGIVRRPLDPTGQVMVAGELWRAQRSWPDVDGDEPVAAGEPVVVDGVRGLTLRVHRADRWEVEGA